MPTLRKFFAALSVFLFLFFFVPPRQAFAGVDNNDINDTCTVILNSTTASNTSGSAPVAPATGLEGEGALSDRAYWNVTVVLGENAASHFARCGGQLKMSTTTGGDDSFLGLGEGISWDNTELSGSGDTFTGRLVQTQNSQNRGDQKWKADVEMRDGSGSDGRGNCDDHEPICRRVYFKPDAYNFDDGTANSCNQQKAALQSFIDDSPSSIQIGQSVSYSIPITNELKTNCNLDGARYKFVRTDSESEDSISWNSVNLSNTVVITNTPNRVGNWKFIFSITRVGDCTSGAGGGGGCSTEEVQHYTKAFCVAASGQETCVPPVDSTNSSPLPPPPYSLCRQIPVLTDTQIQAQVKSIQDAGDARRASQVQRELTARKARQTREKANCCQCTTGNSAWNEATGNCAAEDDANAINLNNEDPGIYTAVGCIGTSSESIITKVVRLGIGIAGGIALLVILSSAFVLTTSQGEPKKYNDAREKITSAIMGLLFIIFSVAILQFIGITILRIPGFGATPTP